MKAPSIESLCYYKLKQPKPWFDEECSKLIDQRMQAKLQWLHKTNQRKRDNLRNLTRKASRTFRKRKRRISERKI
jgi:hypothetical protein